MSKVKALISFSGLISMTQGEVKDVEDSNILDDLLRAKFVEIVKSEVSNPVKSAKGKVKTDENIGSNH